MARLLVVKLERYETERGPGKEMTCCKVVQVRKANNNAFFTIT